MIVFTADKYSGTKPNESGGIRPSSRSARAPSLAICDAHLWQDSAPRAITYETELSQPLKRMGK